MKSGRRSYVPRPTCLGLFVGADDWMNQSTSTVALHPEEVVLFTQMFDYLAVVSGGRNSWKAMPGEQHIEALIQVLDRWPAIHRFPCTSLLLSASTRTISQHLFIVK